MNNYCENPEHKNDPDWHYSENGCPCCRIQELEHRLACWPDLFDENMLLQVRVHELERFVEQTKHTGGINVHLTKRVEELEQQLEEAHTELASSIKERLVLGGQNAKLVEALKRLAAGSPGVMYQSFAAAALKIMEVKGE